MFSAWMKPCCGKDQCTWDDIRSAQLDFLKWVRDNLKVRLAAVEAAISTMEEQRSESEVKEIPITSNSEPEVG
jgi:hypothetical protein